MTSSFLNQILIPCVVVFVVGLVFFAIIYDNRKNIGKIFDIGFTRFISNTWISIIWVIVIVVHCLGAIGATVYSFNVESPVPFLIALFAVPISLLFCRMVLELGVVFFRIESNTRESKEHLREIKELLAQK